MNLFSKMFTFDYSTQRTEGVQYIDKSGLSKALIDKLTPVKKVFTMLIRVREYSIKGN